MAGYNSAPISDERFDKAMASWIKRHHKHIEIVINREKIGQAVWEDACDMLEGGQPKS